MTMYIIIIWFTSFIFFGIIWEIIRRCRLRAKVTSHDLRQDLRAELKGMVESFNENIRTMKTQLASRHAKERKEFLTSIKKQQSRKYLSSVKLTELDNPYFDPEPDEQESFKDKPDEQVLSNDKPDKVELCSDEHNEKHLPSNKYQSDC
ncbi:uncharacterized protein LOC111330197 [Stylophora pistillata]|uniref:uncharacterized protein LOC111330197 n=1 Tax=Stylophora pistillata TaxID=50429 RepID=UPI000C04C1FA|nr:uncharacterized protein LOC111330197 [Stylophora pistillata]